MQRRKFIKLSATGFAALMFHRVTHAQSAGTSLINDPEEVWILQDKEWIKLRKAGRNDFRYQDVQVTLKANNGGQEVYVQSPGNPLKGVRLKWKYDTGSYAKVLGDHWERTYGDVGWKAASPAVKDPWYVLMYDGTNTACFGVKTGTNSICFWNVSRDSLELTMDTHSGGVGVLLGSRRLFAGAIITYISKDGASPYTTATRFCRMMCDKPRLPKQPVYGINDWYAAYGNNSFSSIKEQTAVMAELAVDTKNRPFSVIDDGWQVPDDFARANDKFRDMKAMADEIRSLGMRPGLWTRPLIAGHNDPKNLLAPSIPGRNDPNELILDPTIPENIERVKQNLRLYKDWGYELVKHDYSSYDIFGKWGFQMTDSFTTPGWKYQDVTRTNAEIMNHLYSSIREAAGSMYIIGCNTMSHLSAGVFELNRIGDDTSGKEWARTRKMGVNTLGFRLPQHNAFYAADGDCVGLTKEVPWEKNKQWLQLLAESGSPLFVSAKIEALGEAQKAAVKQAFDHAARVQPTGEPLDWMTNMVPAKWKLNNRVVDFNWD